MLAAQQSAPRPRPSPPRATRTSPRGATARSRRAAGASRPASDVGSRRRAPRRASPASWAARSPSQALQLGEQRVARARAARARPRSGARVRPAGSSSGWPTSRSSAASCWETAEGVRCRASAAAASVPWSATARSARSRRMSTMKRILRVTSRKSTRSCRSARAIRWCGMPRRHIAARRRRRGRLGRELRGHPRRAGALPAAAVRRAAVRARGAPGAALRPPPGRALALRRSASGCPSAPASSRCCSWAWPHGMPAGLASLVLQLQAVFTSRWPSRCCGERPSAGQLAGGALALLGIAVIAAGARTERPARRVGADRRRRRLMGRRATSSPAARGRRTRSGCWSGRAWSPPLPLLALSLLTED